MTRLQLRLHDKEKPAAVANPGLGIRIDVYEMLNVQSVVVGDPGYDVTCIVQLEDTVPGEVTDQKCEALGFEVGPYP